MIRWPFTLRQGVRSWPWYGKTCFRRLTLVVKEAREVEDDKSEMSGLKIPTTRRGSVLSSVAAQFAFAFVA